MSEVEPAFLGLYYWQSPKDHKVVYKPNENNALTIRTAIETRCDIEFQPHDKQLVIGVFPEDYPQYIKPRFWPVNESPVDLLCLYRTIYVLCLLGAIDPKTPSFLYHALRRQYTSQNTDNKKVQRGRALIEDLEGLHTDILHRVPGNDPTEAAGDIEFKLFLLRSCGFEIDTSSLEREISAGTIEPIHL